MCGESILKPVTNSHRHDPCDPEAGAKQIQSGTRDFLVQLGQKHFSGGVLRRPDGRALTPDALLSGPVVVEKAAGLGLTLPETLGSASTTPFAALTRPLVDALGADHRVDVIDSYKQGSFPLTLGELCQTYCSDEEDSSQQRPLNCLSLEISDCSLGRALEAPSLVRQLCWVSRHWNQEANWTEVPQPKVQKYCILSMTDSYTDFHVDFGGSSVWYHVLRGRKTFYLLAPTAANLAAYERWHRMPNHSEVFLPDLLSVDVRCQEVSLTDGQTMFIPAGWIHAVITNERSIVLGGNFLHELNMAMQFK